MLLVYVTCASVAEARRIAGKVVRERLAGCANVVPRIESCYWWKGKLVKDKEALLLLKTVDRNFERLKHRVTQLHSYAVPCIVAYKAKAANKPYAKWLEKETR